MRDHRYILFFFSLTTLAPLSLWAEGRTPIRNHVMPEPVVEPVEKKVHPFKKSKGPFKRFDLVLPSLHEWSKQALKPKGKKTQLHRGHRFYGFRHKKEIENGEEKIDFYYTGHLLPYEDGEHKEFLGEKSNMTSAEKKGDGPPEIKRKWSFHQTDRKIVFPSREFPIVVNKAGQYTWRGKPAGVREILKNLMEMKHKKSWRINIWSIPMIETAAAKQLCESLYASGYRNIRLTTKGK